MLRYVRKRNTGVLLAGIILVLIGAFPIASMDAWDWYALIGGTILVVVAVATTYRERLRSRE